MRIVSVNIARPRLIVLAGRTRKSAIAKVATREEVVITADGLAGDQVEDEENHGGPDQAVYAYSVEDYAWWSAALDRELLPGTFGENLTIEGFESGTLDVGDRFRLAGGAVLEVTAPRIPCGTLAGRMDDATFTRRFAQAGRPGPYLRVLEGGTVRVGDDVELELRGSGVSLLEMVRHFYDPQTPVGVLERALDAPIAIRARDDYRKRIAERS